MSALERVLVTGGGGQLASDLTELLAEGCELLAPTREQLDVSDADAVARLVEDLRPTLIVNCAAFHNVEVCEREERRALEVNCVAVKHMAQLAEQHGARLVHLSTNYVFDGAREEPYGELELPAPRSVYALSKLAGEHAALAYSAEALVVRTAGLYGLHGSVSKGGNFVTRMLTRAKEQGALRMVADQRLSPTFTADLAGAVVEAVEAGAAGVVHLTSSGECSWHEFTTAILEVAGVDVSVAPSATERAPGGADRPLNGVLARPRADALGLTALRSWRAGLEDYMSRAGLAAARVA